MPATSPAAFFSEKIHDYLSSQTALDYGAPALLTVPRFHLGSTAAITNPHLMVKAEADPDSTDTLLTVTLVLELIVQLGTETGQTTAAQAEAWLYAFRALLSPDPDAIQAWDTWTTTLTDAEKDGWYVQQIWPQTTGRDLNETTNVLTLTAPFQIVSYWNN